MKSESKRKYLSAALVLLCAVTTACSPAFIRDENRQELQQRAEKVYLLQMDIVRTTIGMPPGEKPHHIGTGRPNPYLASDEDLEVLLPKGTKVKIFFDITDEYIKVYGYPADREYLDAEYTLLMFVIPDDFVEGDPRAFAPAFVKVLDGGVRSINDERTPAAPVIGGVYNQTVFDVYFNRVLRPAE
jgi:type II secretion system-associated lipoprotein